MVFIYMGKKTSRIGGFGESLAQKYLKRHHYLIIDTNIILAPREIDILAQKDNTYVFIEVKTLRNNTEPAELSLSRKQILTLTKAIYDYCQKHKIKLSNTRLDCIGININKYKKMANIKHYRNILS